MKIRQSLEFENWISELRSSMAKLIYARLYRISEFDHFGDAKSLGNGLAELRWRNGIRVYFFRQDEETIFLLLGGLKNAQVKDIKKAKILHRRYSGVREK